MHFFTLYLYIWRLLGLAPYKRNAATLFTKSYKWLVYSFIFHLLLIFGLLRVMILKYNRGVTGKYVTKTQLFVRLAEQLFSILIIVICVVNRYIKYTNLISLHRRLNSLEQQYGYVRKYSFYIYPLCVQTFYACFLFLRLIFHVTSNTSWHTFIPQWISSMVTCVCDFQWFIYVMRLKVIIQHFNTFARCAISKHSKEFGFNVKYKILMNHQWKIYDLMVEINKCFGIQATALITYRAVRLVASLYAFIRFTFQKELYPFTVPKLCLEIIWFFLRINQLMMLVYPYECVIVQFHKVIQLMRSNFQNVRRLPRNKVRQILLTQLILSRSINFPGCNLFSIRLSLIMNILGAITTYLVIVLDFQSTDIKKKVHH